MQQGLPPAMELEQLKAMKAVGEKMLRGVEAREQLVRSMKENADAAASVLGGNPALPAQESRLQVFIACWARTTHAHAALMEYENATQRENVERDMAQVDTRINELETGIVIARGTVPTSNQFDLRRGLPPLPTPKKN
jgi:hypothetical protein